MGKLKVEPWLTDEGLNLLRAWARRGLTDEQIAHNCGVDRATLARWKKRYTAIRDTLRTAKDVADTAVENALYKRAVGYEVKEVTQYRDDKTGEMVTSKVVTKEIAPDPTSMIFWLKNRAPEYWKDRPVDASETAETQISSFLDALTDAVKVSPPPTQQQGGDPDGS